MGIVDGERHQCCHGRHSLWLGAHHDRPGSAEAEGEAEAEAEAQAQEDGDEEQEVAGRLSATHGHSPRSIHAWISRNSKRWCGAHWPRTSAPAT